MAPKNESLKAGSSGFEGSVPGLGLTDLVELNANNRFSGCVLVQHDQASGLIFFRDGEVIHAEQDDLRGEEAFYEILAWPAGRFSVEPTVSTTTRTIQRSWKFLLMEAHRILDERRSDRAPPARPAAPAAPPRSVSPIQRVRQVPGVAYAVLLDKQGTRVGDDTYEAETLEGQTAYLALLGKRLGELFSLGDLVAATVQGTQQHLLLLASRTHDLSVSVKGDAQPGAVEAEIRKALAPQK